VEEWDFGCYLWGEFAQGTPHKSALNKACAGLAAVSMMQPRPQGTPVTMPTLYKC